MRSMIGIICWAVIVIVIVSANLHATLSANECRPSVYEYQWQMGDVKVLAEFRVTGSQQQKCQMEIWSTELEPNSFPRHRFTCLLAPEKLQKMIKNISQQKFQASDFSSCQEKR